MFHKQKKNTKNNEKKSSKRESLIVCVQFYLLLVTKEPKFCGHNRQNSWLSIRSIEKQKNTIVYIGFNGFCIGFVLYESVTLIQECFRFQWNCLCKPLVKFAFVTERRKKKVWVSTLIFAWTWLWHQFYICIQFVCEPLNVRERDIMKTFRLKWDKRHMWVYNLDVFSLDAVCINLMNIL